ncbi:MAG: DNA repair protein RadC [Parachlamydiales bacterium]|jgi:DNA repair protein RadC
MEKQLAFFKETKTYSPDRLPMHMWAQEDIPGNKFMTKGKQSMSSLELLSIIINSGCKGENAIDIARALLHKFDNSFDNIATASIKQLCQVKGIGPKKALQIQSALEIGNRRRQDGSLQREKVVCSKDIYDLYRHLFVDAVYETFWTVIVNRANKIIKTVQVSDGGISGTTCDPKRIFKMALDCNGSSVFLMHNHPSQSIVPSDADIQLTKKMVNAGKLLDLPITDHLIFGGNSYYSFADENRI